MKFQPLIVAAAILFAPIAAKAEAGSGSIPAKARMLADRGRAFHDAGDYASAIAAFTQAYVMAPSPALLFNLAQAYRLMGKCDDAALMYRRYLATGPSPEERTVAETNLAKVERCADKLGQHIPVSTAAASLVVLPPLAGVTATAPPPAPSHRARIEKGIGIGLVLGGSVAAVVAVSYALQATDAARDVTTAFMRHAKWNDIAAIDARGRSAAHAAWIFGIGGALGVGGGVALYVLGKRTESDRVAVSPTRHGVKVSMSWTF